MINTSISTSDDAYKMYQPVISISISDDANKLEGLKPEA